MICGIGIDVVDLDRISRLLHSNSTHFLRVMFTPEEQILAQNIPAPRLPSYVAGRWAAKEAVLKALGTGIGPVSLHEVIIAASPSHQPCVVLVDRALRIAHDLGIRSWHLSISHEKSIAVAVAIAQSGEG